MVLERLCPLPQGSKCAMEPRLAQGSAFLGSLCHLVCAISVSIWFLLLLTKEIWDWKDSYLYYIVLQFPVSLNTAEL